MMFSRRAGMVMRQQQLQSSSNVAAARMMTRMKIGNITTAAVVVVPAGMIGMMNNLMMISRSKSSSSAAEAKAKTGKGGDDSSSWLKIKDAVIAMVDRFGRPPMPEKGDFESYKAQFRNIKAQMDKSEFDRLFEAVYFETLPENEREKVLKQYSEKLRAMEKKNTLPRVKGQYPVIRSLVDQLLDTIPTKSVIQFNSQKMRWNVQDLKRHTEAYGIALVDLEYLIGDTLVVVLPPGGELIASTLGASYAGVKVCMVNPNTLTEKNLEEILTKTSPKGIVFQQTAPNGNKVVDIVRKVLPDLVKYNLLDGRIYSNPKYPKLEYVVHTGMDHQIGMYRFKELMMYNSYLPLLDDDADMISPQAPWLINPNDFSVMTQTQVLQKAQTLIKETGLGSDQNILLGANDDSRNLATIVGTVAALKSMSNLIVPSFAYDAKTLEAVAKDPVVSAKLIVGENQVTGLKNWWA